MMKIYWDDSGRGICNDAAVAVDVTEAQRIWSDEMGGVRGNFLGLIDDGGRTIQFYVDQTLPEDLEVARRSTIILLDFPMPERKGSFGRHVTVGEVYGLIQRAFDVGADYEQFGELTFSAW